MNLVSLVLAAGKSERFGSAKQLIDVGDISLLNRTIAEFNSLTPEKVVVVLGARHDLIKPTVTNTKHCVFASNWASGMSASINAGLCYVLSEFGQNVSHLAIGLSDQIDVTAPQLNNLKDGMLAYPTSIVAAGYSGSVGAPVIFPRQYFETLLSLNAKDGAKSFISRSMQNVKVIEMPEAAFDIDTLAEFEQWQRRQNNE